VGDEEALEFGQFIAEEAESPFDRAADLLTKEALKEPLENLSYASAACLTALPPRRRAPSRTLHELGTYNITRERIRQIENQSLKKLQQLGAETS
jgi:RNA polymerase primary sigma factor